MFKKFDYVAAALASFITTGVLLVSFPAHAQVSVQQPATEIHQSK